MVELEFVSLFQNLDPYALQTLRRINHDRHFSTQQEIFCEGEAGDGLYVLRRGLVEIGSATGTDRHVFSRFNPGEMFGEMSVIEDRPRSATAMALQESDAYFFPREEILSLIQKSPALSFNLLQEISRRLRDFNRLHLDEILQAERLAVVGNFARSIIHDLKGPLNIIGLAGEIMASQNVTPEKLAKNQGYIRKQIDRINEMIGDILEFSQPANRSATLPLENFRTFVIQLLTELRSESAIKDVQIELRNDPPPVSLMFDPKRLRRVFHNLVQNATDSMQDGGKLFLSFRRESAEVIAEIEDTGPGIAPEIADRLFEAFATHGKSHGTGLGLYICRKIMEDFHGRI